MFSPNDQTLGSTGKRRRYRMTALWGSRRSCETGVKKEQGFSTTELLVGVVLVTILVTLIFQSISRARSQADATVCLENLRSIGLAINLYSNDHNDLLPGPEFSLVDMERGNLVPKLKPYLQTTRTSNKIWRCPANPTMDPRYSTYRTRTPLFGYNYTPPRSPAGAYSRLKIISSHGVSDRWIMEDIDALNYSPGSLIGRGNDGPVHSGARNRLFIDGHVERYVIKP